MHKRHLASALTSVLVLFSCQTEDQYHLTAIVLSELVNEACDDFPGPVALQDDQDTVLRHPGDDLACTSPEDCPAFCCACDAPGFSVQQRVCARHERDIIEGLPGKCYFGCMSGGEGTYCTDLASDGGLSEVDGGP